MNYKVSVWIDPRYNARQPIDLQDLHYVHNTLLTIPEFRQIIFLICPIG